MNMLYNSPVDSLNEVSVPQGSLLINWIGQAGFLFKTAGGKTLCIDPYLSNSIEKFEGLENRRMWWPSMKMDKFKTNGVFLTHDHLDHTDTETLPIIEAFAQPEKYFAPPSSIALLKAMNMRHSALVTVKPGDCVRFYDMLLRPVFAKHTDDSLGLILEAAGLKFYITGDTSMCPELELLKYEGIDVLISCINGFYANLNINEAVGLAKTLGAGLLVPMHFGVVPANTVRPELFLRCCAETDTPNLLMAPEEHYLFTKTNGQVQAERM